MVFQGCRHCRHPFSIFCFFCINNPEKTGFDSFFCAYFTFLFLFLKTFFQFLKVSFFLLIDMLEYIHKKAQRFLRLPLLPLSET